MGDDFGRYQPHPRGPVLSTGSVGHPPPETNARAELRWSETLLAERRLFDLEPSSASHSIRPVAAALGRRCFRQRSACSDRINASSTSMPRCERCSPALWLRTHRGSAALADSMRSSIASPRSSAGRRACPLDQRTAQPAFHRMPTLVYPCSVERDRPLRAEVIDRAERRHPHPEQPPVRAGAGVARHASSATSYTDSEALTSIAASLRRCSPERLPLLSHCPRQPAVPCKTSYRLCRDRSQPSARHRHWDFADRMP